MARILAFDFGTKRTGIAVSDPQQQFAFPLKVMHASELLPFIEAYLKQEAVDTFVVGEPKHLNGDLSGPREALDNFVRYLQKQFPNVALFRVDERFTSSMAMETMLSMGTSKKQRAQKENTDQISAVLILQSFLEQRSFGRM